MAEAEDKRSAISS